MLPEIEQPRTKIIYQTLLEMANGNFSYRIPRTKKEDTLEGLTILINCLAEEMEEALFHIGYVNPHMSYRFIVQNTYILDYNCIINDFSLDVPELLEINANKLIGLHFSKILEKKSLTTWQTAKNQLLQNEICHATLLLKFITSKNALVPALCSVTKLLKKEEIIVSLFKVEKNNAKNTLQKIDRRQIVGIHKKTDLRLIQSVYDYIMAHKNTSLPTLKELARIFGTNEFKLKVGFRYLFKTSIYQLHTSERLKKARLLIENTIVPLKEIAYMSGYNTYSNFSRAFKIKYGCAPNAIPRKA